MEVQLIGKVAISYSPEVTKLLGRNYWYLENTIDVSIRTSNHHYEFSIPYGYLTDGATVPRIMWSFVPLWDECTSAVVIHDYLCNQKWIKIDGIAKTIDRKTVDDIFLGVMEFNGVNKMKRYTIYNAVRLHAELFNHKDAFYPEQKLEMERLIRENIDKGYYK